MGYNRSITMICPAAARDAALAMGVALGVDAGFAVELSADGNAPATHCACHMMETDAVAAVLLGQVYPTTIPEGITEADIDQMLAAITVSVDPVVDDQRLTGRSHFDHVLAATGLQEIETEII